MLFWEHGDKARLEIGGEALPECRKVGGSPTSPPKQELSQSQLVGNEWIVDDIDGRGIIDYSRATLKFSEDGRLAGRASCNTYSGSFDLVEGVLTVGRMAVTRRACPPALMDQERRFLEILETVRRAELTANGALVLSTPAGRKIQARR